MQVAVIIELCCVCALFESLAFLSNDCSDLRPAKFLNDIIGLRPAKFLNDFMGLQRADTLPLPALIEFSNRYTGLA